MAYDVYLICFLGETRPVDVVKELWPEHRHLTGSNSGLAEGGAELLIVADERRNGVTLVADVYKRIQNEVGRPFRGIVVPMTSTLAGYHRSEIVEWINKVTQ